MILARAGSKGLPGKNAIPLLGRPLCAWTFEHAVAARVAGVIAEVVVSTDCDRVAAAAGEAGLAVIERPAGLADDTATVDAAARHACDAVDPGPNRRFDAVVILYANVPARPDTLIADAMTKLRTTGCDSVQSVCPVGKYHPAWMKTLDGDRLRPNPPYADLKIHRRQDLPPLFQLDGGIIAVTRVSLDRVDPTDPHAFLGEDRRAVLTEPGAVIDIDTAADLALAAAVLAATTRRGDEILG